MCEVCFFANFLQMWASPDGTESEWLIGWNWVACRLIVVPLAHGIEPEERSRHVLSLIVDVVKSIHFGEVADFTLCNQDSAVSRSSVTLIRKAVCLTVLNSLPSDKPLLLHTIFEILYLKSILFPVLTRIGKDHLEDISNQICLQRPAKIQRKSKGRYETEKCGYFPRFQASLSIIRTRVM